MNAKETIRRRRLPHWDVPGAIYFVTACLQGSIPAEGLLQLEQDRKTRERCPPPENMNDQEWALQKWKLAFSQREKWLDTEPAVRHLADARLANAVVDTIYHFLGVRYELLAYVVMPSHYHWVFRPLESWVESRPDEDLGSPRERIMHSVNLHSARQCNRLLGRKGTFWQNETYDHWVRNTDELERIIRYVEDNPVKADLAKSADEWRFSSARDRAISKLANGLPLPPRNVRQFS